jgi:hypothetical protein
LLFKISRSSVTAMLFDGDRPLSKLANQDFKNGPVIHSFFRPRWQRRINVRDRACQKNHRPRCKGHLRDDHG